MGIYDSISSLFQSWRRNKRKREHSTEDTDASDNKMMKLAAPYVVTPVSNLNYSTTTNRDIFNYQEELNTTENRNIEYKEGGCLFKKDVLCQLIQKYGSAFLNSEGGTLLCGVNDSGIVKGVYISPKSWNEIVETTKYEMSLFRPYVPDRLFDIKFIPVIYGNNKRTLFQSSCSTNNMYVVQFQFKKGYDGELYETGFHKVYLRRDGGVQGPLRPLDIKNLVITNYIKTLKGRKIIKEKETAMESRLKSKGISYVTID